jgi:hypothetical protein
MKIPKIKIKKLKEFLERLPRALGERAFLTFLGLLVLALIFGGIIFYKYQILVKRAKIQITEEPLQFQEKIYQDILKIWQEKEKNFKETDSKEYPNPFI